MKKGFCGIGIWYPSKETNIGTLFRTAYAMGVDFTFTIGRKYRRQASDTVNSILHLPYYHYDSYEHFMSNRPIGCRIVCVEIDSNSRKLGQFIHPAQAIYLLGSESGGLPKDLLQNNLVVEIPSETCLNIAVAGSIVLYDMINKNEKIVA